MFRPGLGFGQRYHVDRHGQLTLKQLRLSVLNEMHTNSYTGPRLKWVFSSIIFVSKFAKDLQPCKLDAIAATATFACTGCKLSANLSFRPVIAG